MTIEQIDKCIDDLDIIRCNLHRIDQFATTCGHIGISEGKWHIFSLDKLKEIAECCNRTIEIAYRNNSIKYFILYRGWEIFCLEIKDVYYEQRKAD